MDGFIYFQRRFLSLHNALSIYLLIQGNEQPTFTSLRCERILIRDIIHAFRTWAHYWGDGGESGELFFRYYTY